MSASRSSPWPWRRSTRRDLPKLVEVMRRLNIEDPNLVVTINQESGETLMSGMGVLHLEIATTMIQQAGLEIITSPPIINYRETIRTRAGPIMARSPEQAQQDIHRGRASGARTSSSSSATAR